MFGPPHPKLQLLRKEERGRRRKKGKRRKRKERRKEEGGKEIDMDDIRGAD